MKGLHWRYGSIAFQKVTTDMMTQLDIGNLYVTSKRVFFDGTKKNISIPLAKITNFTVFKDGLQIEKEAGKDLYFLGALDWDSPERAWTEPQRNCIEVPTHPKLKHQPTTGGSQTGTQRHNAADEVVEAFGTRPCNSPD
jgi:hypothetical protein